MMADETHKPLREVCLSGLETEEVNARVDAFFATTEPAEKLRAWYGSALLADKDADFLLSALERDIAFIDDALTRQLNAILHHPSFLRLEGSWRGVLSLCSHLDGAKRSAVKIINLSWREIERDFEQRPGFDESDLFQKIYSNEFGMPGGQPFGAILCDHELRHRIARDHPHDDISIVAHLAAIGAAAFAPVIMGVAPAFFGLDSFCHAERLRNLPHLMSQAEYRRYERLREEEDCRFLALVLPRVLARKPYFSDGMDGLGFRYREDTFGLAHEHHCWTNGVYAFGEILLRTFNAHGWFTEMVGAARDRSDHGVIVGAPATRNGVEEDGPYLRPGVETEIPPDATSLFVHKGFTVINVCKDTPLLAVNNAVAIKAPTKYGKTAAQANDIISSLLRYILCVARFAHYIKVIIRDNVGRFSTPAECEALLQQWLMNFATGNDDATMELRARYPLREARVEVRERRSAPGHYDCTLHLRPHFQIDHISTTFKLVTQVSMTNRPGLAAGE